MDHPQSSSDPFLKRTKSAYLWTRVLDTPFWGLFNLLPFILYKDLHATPFQLGLIITLKPLVSILSSYWASRAQRQPGKVVSSLLYGRWLAYLPFFAFPFIHSPWYLIGCFGFYMFFQVGMMPSWMELLKQNLPAETREKVFSYTQAFGYLGGGLLPFVIGWMLDEWFEAWRWMFPIAALMGLSAFLWQRRILVRSTPNNAEKTEQFHPLVHPWKSSWNLLKRRPDFAKFQIGFMLIGSGLMIIQPTLPVFFVDNLHLSYMEMGVAITLCKGVGFACSSPFWVKWMQKVNLFQFGSMIALLAALFPVLLVAAQTQMLWLYLAYLTYGFMQSGNELSWNMSGPIFAKNDDSTPYSTVNVIAVGVRGIFVPTLGAFCLSEFGSLAVIAISGILFVLAAIRMGFYNRQKQSIATTL